MISESSTHLLVLFDNTGRITSIGEVDQNEIERQGGGQVFLNARDRHFAQIELTNTLRSSSHGDLMDNYIVDHVDGADASLVMRESQSGK